MVALKAAHHPRAGLSLVRGVPSSVDGLSNEQVFRELLPLHPAPVARHHAKSRVQKPGDCLHGVELAVTVQRESDYVAGVLLVPGDP